MWYPTSMKQVSISLSEVDLRNVDTVAMYDSISRSGVIRRAVKDYFDRRAHGIDGLLIPTALTGSWTS